MNLSNLFEKYPELKNINIKNKDFFNKFIFSKLKKNTILAGHECPGLIFLLDGSIDIYSNDSDGTEVYLYRLAPGDYCHNSIYCHMKNISLNIIGYCTENSKIAILPNNLIKDFLLTNPSFLSIIYQDLLKKSDTIIQQKRSILHLSIEERIINFLKNSNSSVITITHRQLANYIHTSREVVSRNLKILENKGLIETKLGKIIINSQLIDF